MTQCLLQPNTLLAFTSLYLLPTTDGWLLKERTWQHGTVLACQNIATCLTQLKAFEMFRSQVLAFRDRAHNEALQLGARFTSSSHSPFAWELLSRGSLVSSLHPIEAYSSGRDEMPFCFFEPGDVGKVAEVDVPAV